MKFSCQNRLKCEDAGDLFHGAVTELRLGGKMAYND